MALHPLAGKPAPVETLVHIPRLVTSYFAVRPDPADPSQRVAFGTSGHRGSALLGRFNERHILAIAQAIVEHRAAAGVTGPLFVGIDTHALSEPAMVSAVEVFAAHGVEVVLQEGEGYTPTPVVSHAILSWNRHHPDGPTADGVVITPSHNPPDDGGFKYNPPHGGPADGAVTKAIEARANALLEADLAGVSRIPWERARRAPTTRFADLVRPYVEDLGAVIDLPAIARSGLRIGVDPMGGASVAFWPVIAERWGVSLDVTNPRVDPTFGFMTCDKDGKIRMDCSSPYAMARLVELKDRYDIAFGNDADADRHGIVTPTGGLMNPNHFLAVAIDWLFRTRTGWGPDLAVGKTLVSSAMIDRVAGALGRRLAEVPVGFKYFVDGLRAGRYGFGGEESAGASFLRMDGTVWTTDKDGLLLDLLAAEITAKSGKDPSVHYRALEATHGAPVYERLDAPATGPQKKILERLSPDAVNATDLAGEPILAKLTRSPEGDQAIGGLKVVTANGWFAARPSGTEDIYKIYAESFLGRDHLRRLQSEAQEMVAQVFGAG